MFRKHDVQQAYRLSEHRYNAVPAGRRSGKTELAKRKVVLRALKGTAFPDARFFLGAPTRDQAKRIFWLDLKAMIPALLKQDVSETELRVTLATGASIWVLGFDKPERVEGVPWDGGVLDEYGNMKPSVWPEHVRPALADREGWCDFIGVPEGRNHYYDLDRAARAQMAPGSEWGEYHWISADILPAAEIEAAKRDLDDLTYQQEFEGSFVNFHGRAYYPFLEGTHCASVKDRYRPRAPLCFCFDFNVDPGVAAVCQEMKLPNGQQGTGFLGEVHIPRNSNTPAVCRKLIQDWGAHEGFVRCYGDATGGARGSAKVQGSDWDLVRSALRSHFGQRLRFRVPNANPSERARINAVNSRLKSASGEVRMMVDPQRCPWLVRDFEGVGLLEGGSGEIDKKKDSTITHLSDAAGYYVAREFPVRAGKGRKVELKYG